MEKPNKRLLAASSRKNSKISILRVATTLKSSRKKSYRFSMDQFLR